MRRDDSAGGPPPASGCSAAPSRSASSIASSSDSNVERDLVARAAGVTLTSAPSARPKASPSRAPAASLVRMDGAAARRGRAVVARGRGGARLGLGVADGPALGGRGAGEPAAVVVVGRHQERAAVALGELAGGEQVERLVGEVEQAQQVRDRDARAARRGGRPPRA